MTLAGTARASPDAKRMELFGKIALLAALYYGTGKLGLLLAVPPGYATSIWPPSGIAIGMLIMHGARLWPGVLIGSFLLNAPIPAEAGGISAQAIVTAALIACGSACQAAFGRAIVARILGLPLELRRIKDALLLLALTGPLACLIAPTVGIGSLYFAGSMPLERIVGNWLTWWSGDTFGVVLFLPLMLVAPGSSRRLTWRGHKVTALPILAMLTLMLPLGLTFYAWKLFSEHHYTASLTEFETLAFESEKALQHRLQSYAQALLGAVGLTRATHPISRVSWRHYVHAINPGENFPGVNGIGYITEVKPDGVAEFLRMRRQEDSPDFTIHPQAGGLPLFVITYIEPVEINKQAAGLNIAFEENRRAAAILARDSGKATITKRIVLVQDETKSPGFLLLQPVYARETAFDTVEVRRAAFRGWIYAPFVGQNFMRDLTQSQGAMLDLSVYDGGAEDGSSLIYASQARKNSGAPPSFRVSKTLHLMQRNWTLVWTSTPAYEAAETSREPEIVLIAGLAFTALVGAFLSGLARRSEIIRRVVAEQTNLLKLQHAELVGAQEELWHINENLELRVAERTADLQEARKAAEAASRVKSDFLSNISHELRTPMHAILNCAKIGMSHLRDGNLQKMEKYLNNIHMSGERLSNLLNDLLELSRMESGKVNLKLQRCNVLEIIQIAAAELDTLKTERNINLIINSETAHPSVHCDRQQILRVFINLYSNAIKYSPVGGTIAITIADAETAQGAPALRCTVKDQGIGIPANELDMVFDKFVQSSKTRTGAGGTGLGLAICKEIVELHKGQIWAENGPAGGAVLQVLLVR